MNSQRVALIGNPNSGKTTLFNALTGSTQQTGNWPGVTVEKKSGRLLQYKEIELIDLPGTYSLGEYSEDELVAKRYLLDERPDAVIDVIDASNLKRNLYLTMLLLEMGENIVLAVNMLDAAKSRNAEVDVEKLSVLLGVPAVPTVGVKGKGVQELADSTQNNLNRTCQSFRIDYGHELEHHLCKLERMLHANNFCKMQYHPIESPPRERGRHRGFRRQRGADNNNGVECDNNNRTLPALPARYLAVKILENNQNVMHLLMQNGLTEEQIADIAKDREHLEGVFNEDVESVIIEKRYGFIEGIVKQVVKKKRIKEGGINRKISVSDTIDTVVLNRYLAIPIFLFIMFLMFQITFSLGGIVADLFESALGAISAMVGSGISHPLLKSFVVEGVLGGLGGILVFVPNIFLLFFVLSILEDSGYMARGAYLMDGLMRKIGLQGKSFIPMVTGFGCSVPAVMATRTLESKNDRMITMMVLPFMSCGARLPVYVLFAGAFFAERETLVVFSLYLLGIAVAVLMAKIFRKTLFPGENTPFVLELPPYRIPTLRGVMIHMWDRGSEFLRKAGTLIFAVVILIWVLSNLPYGVEYASQESFIGQIGSLLAIVFKPLGFGTWEAATALIFGVVAKEVVVATLGTVYAAYGNLGMAIQQFWTPLAGYSFMIMTLLYTPCIATLSAIRRETRSTRWMLFSMVYSFVVAWVASFLFYQIGSVILSLMGKF